MRARTLLLAAFALTLSACGFHLRGDVTYPFDSIFVNASVSPPLSLELTRALSAASQAKALDSPSNAQAVLDVPSVVDD